MWTVDPATLPARTFLAPTVDKWVARRGRALIRQVVEADLEPLRLMRNSNDVRKWLGDNREISSEQQRAWFERTAANGCAIVELSGNPIGLIKIPKFSLHRPGGIFEFNPREAPLDHDNFYGEQFYEIGIDAFDRGSGTGAVLMEYACRFVTRPGMNTRIHLWTFLANTRSFRLSQSAGFEECPRTEVKWLMRNFDELGHKPCAMIRMVLP